jgi:hypothetical protein
MHHNSDTAMAMPRQSILACHVVRSGLYWQHLNIALLCIRTSEHLRCIGHMVNSLINLRELHRCLDPCSIQQLPVNTPLMAISKGTGTLCTALADAA